MSNRADTILRIARTRGAQTLSSAIGLLRVVWSMRVSARCHAATLNMAIVRGGSSGPRKTKHSLPLKKTCVSPRGNRRWLRKLRPADRGASVPWRKLSDGRESVLSTLPSGSTFFALIEAQENCHQLKLDLPLER